MNDSLTKPVPPALSGHYPLDKWDLGYPAFSLPSLRSPNDLLGLRNGSASQPTSIACAVAPARPRPAFPRKGGPR